MAADEEVTVVSRGRRFGSLSVATLLVLCAASSAPALTLCIAPCDFGPPPSSGEVIAAPLPPLSLEPPSIELYAPNPGNRLVLGSDGRVLLSGGAFQVGGQEPGAGGEITPIAPPADLVLRAGSSRCVGSCTGIGGVVIGNRFGNLLPLAGNGVTLRDATVRPVAAMPEPSAALLFGIGVLVVGARTTARTRRRR